MPIDYKKYPPNWMTEIRPRILLRSSNKCEFEGCGLSHGETVLSYKENGITIWAKRSLWPIVPKEYKEVKVILTIAHLDHDEFNHLVKDDRLMAMCQLHHLRYDAEEKRRRFTLKTSQ